MKGVHLKYRIYKCRDCMDAKEQWTRYQAKQEFNKKTLLKFVAKLMKQERLSLIPKTS